MRSALVGLILAATIFGGVPPAHANSAAGEAVLAVGATLIDLVYVPVKLTVALGGVVVGGVTGCATGGDTRAQYAILVPTTGGTYFVTPAHLEGTRPFEFFGSDYADQVPADELSFAGRSHQ